MWYQVCYRWSHICTGLKHTISNKCSKTIKYLVTLLHSLTCFMQIYVIGQCWGEGHQSERMRHQNNLKAKLRMYLSSQNNTHITNIHYRKLQKIMTKIIEWTAGVKTVCCSEFNKFNTLPIANKYLLEEPPCNLLKTQKIPKKFKP